MTDKTDILLKEYEICQKESDGSAQNYWTTFGIFTGLSTAVMSAAAAIIIKGKSSLYNDLQVAILLIFGITVFIVLCFLRLWLRRVNSFIGIDNRRMREIEAQLGMDGTIRIWILDNWEKLIKVDRAPNENVLVLEDLKISGKTVMDYMKNIGETFEFITPKEKQELKDLKISIPEKYRPPPTGGKIISNLFRLVLLTFWAIFIGLVAVILVLWIFN